MPPASESAASAGVRQRVAIRRPVLGPAALDWADRAVWAVCIGVYLTIYVSGVLGGGDELWTMARAIGFTLVAGLLAKKAVSLLTESALFVEEGPSADQLGPVGSLADLLVSTNVPTHEDAADQAA